VTEAVARLTATGSTRVAIVKGATPAADWALVTLAGGGTRKVAVQVIRDLPHLVVESVFGIEDGRWGTLAGGGSPGTSRPGHVVAGAAVDAVVNRWRRGPDTPDGVRDRLRARAQRETWLAARIAGLGETLADGEIRAARDGVRLACRQWARLPAGGALRLSWPLGHGQAGGRLLVPGPFTPSPQRALPEGRRSPGREAKGTALPGGPRPGLTHER
jgi:hypothetical protein